MPKPFLRAAALAVAAAAAGFVAAPGASAQAAMGPHAAACRAGSGRAAILVNVSGFKQRTGTLRVQLYRADNTFLERGEWLQRVDLRVTPSGAMPVCIPAPAPGTYAVAVRHDLDGNGRSGWSDGGGFSRNPRISLTNLRPSVRNVAIDVGSGVTTTNVVLNYRFGLSIRPVG